MKLEINPAARLDWQVVGDHGTPVLVVDDFLRDAPGLRALALGLAYRAPGAPDFYPGVKAYISLPGSAATKTWVAERMLERLYPAPQRRPPILRTDDYDETGAFSIFSVDRARLPATVADQHTDGFAWLAMVLHLSTESDGRGTAMWEHRPTGLQSWLATDPVRLQFLERALGLRLNVQLANATQRVPLLNNDDVARQIFRSRPGRTPFSTEEDQDWRLLHYVPAKLNRLVVYPTWQIHSVVDMSTTGPTGAESVRLTHNQMVEFPVARELRKDRLVYERGVLRVPVLE